MTDSMTQPPTSTASFGLLMQHDDLLIKQQVGGCCKFFCESIGCCEAPQEYHVAPVASPKANFMYAKEESSCFNRCCCGTMRSFEINLHAGDNRDAPVMIEMERPLRCSPGSPCTMCCCNQEMKVTVNQKEFGRAYIPWYCCQPFIRVEDDQGEMLYEIEKEGICPCVICECCRQPFNIKDAEGKKVGKVIKKYDGALKEMFTDADTFQLNFPKGSTPEHRALLIAATFLLDINFFETDNNDDN